MSFLSRVGRPMLAGVFVMGAYNQWRHPEGPEAAARGLLEELPSPPVTAAQAVRANAVAMGVGGAGLALGVAPRLAAAVLAGALVPTTYAGHAFWRLPPGQERTHSMLGLVSNVAVLGGLLQVMGRRRDR